MRVEYSSNNSGGSWWLEDKDWIALEAAGWEIEWGGVYFCHSVHNSLTGHAPTYPFTECATDAECSGHRSSLNHEDVSRRNLGCLAKCASKEFPTLADAIREFEKVTGQDAMDEGCNCCGPPHSFSGDGDYASGEGCGEHLYDNSPKTYRDALRALEEK